MHSPTKAIVAAVAIAGLGVVGMDAYTYAGTGDSVILGKLNKANKTTHVKSTGQGPALSLHAQGRRPALAVDSRAKIVRLNADAVDGRSAADLRTRGRVYSTSVGTFSDGSARFVFPAQPKGAYLVSYAVYLSGSGGAHDASSSANCRLKQIGDSGVAVWSSGVSVRESEPIGLSASSMWTSDGSRWALDCDAVRGRFDLPWSVSAELPVKISFLRVDRKVSGRLSRTATS